MLHGQSHSIPLKNTVNIFVNHVLLIQVLDNGELVEFDEPYTLLQDSNSMLSKLVQQTGKGVATELMEIAEAHQHSKNTKKLSNGGVHDR